MRRAPDPLMGVLDVGLVLRRYVLSAMILRRNIL
jgi:hypothetical protein